MKVESIKPVNVSPIVVRLLLDGKMFQPIVKMTTEEAKKQYQ